MTTFLLIRHATNDWVGKAIAGWKPGVHLNAEGRAQAEALATRLAGAPLRAIYSSSLERALETARPLAERFGLDMNVLDTIGEVKFGYWTGCAIADLDRTPLWQRFNSYRSGTRAPEGELMLESQLRIVTALERLREAHRDQWIAVVSHADLIRSALVYFLGMSVDHFHRLEIYPASVTTIEMNDDGLRLLGLNDTGRYCQELLKSDGVQSS
jgi:probable phosphomutase (TIGR03848 family)